MSLSSKAVFLRILRIAWNVPKDVPGALLNWNSVSGICANGPSFRAHTWPSIVRHGRLNGHHEVFHSANMPFLSFYGHSFRVGLFHLLISGGIRHFVPLHKGRRKRDWMSLGFDCHWCGEEEDCRKPVRGDPLGQFSADVTENCPHLPPRWRQASLSFTWSLACHLQVYIVLWN